MSYLSISFTHKNTDIQTREKIAFSDNSAVEMFLKNGANPNIIVDDESPLHYAVNSENVKLVEILLDNGADPNIIKNIDSKMKHIDLWHYTY